MTNEGGDMQVELDGWRLELFPYSDGTAGLRYRLFGLFPIQTERLQNIRMSRGTLSGREVLFFHNKTGLKSVAGEKIPVAPVSLGLIDTAGEYEIVSAREAAFAPKKVLIRYSDGLLIANGLPYTGLMSPLVPAGDNQAVLAGLGRTRGETVHFTSKDGEDYVQFSGLLFKRIKNRESRAGGQISRDAN